MQNIAATTPLTVSYPDAPACDFDTTWADFVSANAGDIDTLADIAAQIVEHGYAQIGGGAAPQTWIFAGEIQ